MRIAPLIQAMANAWAIHLPFAVHIQFVQPHCYGACLNVVFDNGRLKFKRQRQYSEAYQRGAIQKAG